MLKTLSYNRANKVKIIRLGAKLQRVQSGTSAMLLGSQLCIVQVDTIRVPSCPSYFRFSRQKKQQARLLESRVRLTRPSLRAQETQNKNKITGCKKPPPRPPQNPYPPLCLTHEHRGRRRQRKALKCEVMLGCRSCAVNPREWRGNE